MNTYDLRHAPVILTVALTPGLEAEGTVIFDDGESLNTIENQFYTEMKYTWSFLNHTHDSFRMEPQVSGWWQDDEYTDLMALHVFGCIGRPVDLKKLNYKTGVTEDIEAHITYSYQTAQCWFYFKSAIMMNEDSEIFIDYSGAP